MGTSYKALLRAFVITSPTFTTCRCVISRKSRYGTQLFYERGACRNSRPVYLLRSYWKGYPYLPVILCFTTSGGLTIGRRTFEFLTSGHLRHSGQIVTFFSAEGWLTINAPKRVSRSLHATFGSRSCVFLEFFSLLAEFLYDELSTVRLFVVNGSNPSIIYTRFMS